MALHRVALRERIGIAPGQIFSPDHRFSHCIRINCGHSGSIVLPALQRLGALTHALLREST
jgi:DNA-binding transcriptional MocR family regulator